jgi:hypothetical protein
MKYKLIHHSHNSQIHLLRPYHKGFLHSLFCEKPKRKDCCITITNAVYQNNQESLNNNF